MMLVIPIENPTPYFTESVNVGDVSLSMRFMWNDRDQHWFLDLESVDGKNNGVRVVVNTPLLSGKNNCIKAGDLIVLQNTTDEIKSLGYENLGTDFVLFYMSHEELEQYRGAVASMTPSEAS